MSAPAAGAETLDGFRRAIDRVARREDLDADEAARLMGAIMDGAVPATLIAAFLVGLRAKGETVDEIVGCARAIRDRALPFPAAAHDLVDTCGTGGDGAGTFNISTGAAFVAAGAGARVAKHGNRAVSSRTGSADVLECLGVDVAMAGPAAAGALDAAGVTFLFAPTFHAAMRHAAPVRRELGVRTVFNLLGPLCNPAGARAQLVGVFNRALVRPVAEALGRLGATRALVVHGADGLDELTVTGPSFVAEWDGERVRESIVEPLELGLAVGPAEDLRGGDAARNAQLLRAVLTPGAAATPADTSRRDVVVLNAAAALVVAGRAASLREGIDVARDSLRTGAALGALDALVRYSGGLRAAALPRAERQPVAPTLAGWGR